jgi:hypothetical protein
LYVHPPRTGLLDGLVAAVVLAVMYAGRARVALEPVA